MKISDREYKISEVITFRDTKGKYGALSNMSPNFSLFVNEILVSNSESLYQACRFPLFPHIQKAILDQRSPMDAKAISRKYIAYTRQDWELVKFDVMKWCLRVKLIQNWDSFSLVLRETDNKPIVEYSKEDKIWAAVPKNKEYLVGKNALGRLLMDIREKYVMPDVRPMRIEPLNIPGFMLLKHDIGFTYPPDYFIEDF